MATSCTNTYDTIAENLNTTFNKLELEIFDRAIMPYIKVGTNGTCTLDCNQVINSYYNKESVKIVLIKVKKFFEIENNTIEIDKLQSLKENDFQSVIDNSGQKTIIEIMKKLYDLKFRPEKVIYSALHKGDEEYGKMLTEAYNNSKKSDYITQLLNASQT